MCVHLPKEEATRQILKNKKSEITLEKIWSKDPSIYFRKLFGVPNDLEDGWWCRCL
jgi:hypothetical protein